MTSFSVDPESLETFSTNLSHRGSLIDQMKSINAADASGLGGAPMQSTIEHFARTWGYGASQIENHVSNLVKNSAQASKNYEAAENDITTAARNAD